MMERTGLASADGLLLSSLVCALVLPVRSLRCLASLAILWAILAPLPQHSLSPARRQARLVECGLFYRASLLFHIV